MESVTVQSVLLHCRNTCSNRKFLNNPYDCEEWQRSCAGCTEYAVIEAIEATDPDVEE